MLKGFRDFILRGNVVDLAVAVIIGAAFSGIVSSLVNDVLKQLIAAIVGKPDFSYVVLDLHGTPIRIGNFLTASFRSFDYCFSRLLRRGAAVEHAVVEDQEARAAGSSRDQSLPRVPERDSARREALRALRTAGSGGVNGRSVNVPRGLKPSLF